MGGRKRQKLPPALLARLDYPSYPKERLLSRQRLGGELGAQNGTQLSQGASAMAKGVFYS